MVTSGRKKVVLWGIPAAVAAVLLAGAIIGAFSTNKIQGDVQVKIINDTRTGVGFALCHDSGCEVTDSIETLAPSAAYDQAVGPEEVQRFAIKADPSFDEQSSPVAGKAYRCTQLTTDSVVNSRRPKGRGDRSVAADRCRRPTHGSRPAGADLR
jgi:hypothetical protein